MARARGRDEVVSEADKWLLQIELADKRAEKWETRCDKIVKRYRDERGDSESHPRRMNMLWSNVQTLQPSLYGREPTPIAERRFLDKDVIGRVAAQILERALRYEMADCGYHDTLTANVLDLLLVGRGTAWLRYVPSFDDASSPTEMGDDQIDDEDDEEREPPPQELIGASLDVDYVHWKDFRHSKARTWKEVEWVGRRLHLGRGDLIARFGEEVGNSVPIEMDRSSGSAERMTEEEKKAEVWEVWFKPTRTVYFVAKGHHDLLDERPDPLGLAGFWPCPRPLYATLTNDSLEPVPDYAEYQDQAQEIDDLTARIDALAKALRIAGVYDASNKELGRILSEGFENRLIPVANWAALTEKGGLANGISFLPVKEVAETVLALNEAREQAKKDLYEITGLSDVIRGQADPRETATAVQTKGRFGSLRLQARQKEVARYCRDIIAMMGEIVAEHYPDDALINVSGILYDDGIGEEEPKAPEPPTPQQMQPPAQPVPMMGHNGGPPMSPPEPQGAPQAGMAPPEAPSPIPPVPPALMAFQQAQQEFERKHAEWDANRHQMIASAIQLLRQDKLRGFRIDIETDSTIADDAMEEKQARMEFLTAASGFLKQAMEAGKEDPDIIPLAGKMMLFGVRGFRVGRDLESAFEDYIDTAEKDAKQRQSQPPPPDPEQIKAQADMQLAQSRLQEAQLKMQADQQMSQARMQEAQVKAQADQARAQAEVQAQQVEAQSEAQNAQQRLAEKQMDLRIKQFEAETRMSEIARQEQFEMQRHEQKMRELAAQGAHAARENAAAHVGQAHEHAMEMVGHAHDAAMQTIGQRHEVEMAEHAQDSAADAS